ncbi:unnamed protein product [Prunus armeniaca]|uniref:P-type ATPase A domain-containing protein n=1 Tax=Prunus armeniaca TaxID=36596 RepID=A0A6J5Y019_PRUAR|nr:unnamed protein product [Prunus armeniaca]CAB4319470.1 unnamed protein product [Prunus armeniaca]
MIRVIRGGRRVEVSIYDLVVGDVVPLNIGDQVPAGGILIMGHSLAIDESSMTRDHNTMSLYACYVTNAGINTKWEFLMPSISKDIGDETLLQVRLTGVANIISIVGLKVAVHVMGFPLLR